MLGWTLVLALVFSAGLITGQRMLREESTAPLVSVSAGPTPDTEAAEQTAGGEQSDEQEPVFSFYDRLSKGIDPIKPKSARQEESGEPASDGPTPPDEAKKEETEQAQRYTLQVSAHSRLERARARMKSLKKMGLEPHVVSAQIPNKGEYFRVQVGKFGTMKAAKTFKDELERKRGIKTFVSPL
jgi:septal ring-binding cell division protein DamX